MAHVIADRVQETSTTTGTGAFTLAGAVAGFRTFASVCSTSDTLPYSTFPGLSLDMASSADTGRCRSA